MGLVLRRCRASWGRLKTARADYRRYVFALLAGVGAAVYIPRRRRLGAISNGRLARLPCDCSGRTGAEFASCDLGLWVCRRDRGLDDLGFAPALKEVIDERLDCPGGSMMKICGFGNCPTITAVHNEFWHNPFGALRVAP